MASLFFSEQLGTPGIGDECTLTGAEAKHVFVNRVRPGQTLRIGDGVGTVVSGPVTAVSAGQVAMQVARITRRERPAPRIGLAQALATGGRGELAVQEATELGADVIIPWAAHRCVARWSPQKAERAGGRWQAVAREAAKQAIRPWVPEVLALHDLDGLAALAAAWQLVVLDPTAPTGLAGWLAGTPGAAGSPGAGSPGGYDRSRDILFVIGPEGGLEDDEVARLSAAGAARVRLGRNILRTSTAGPAAIAVVNAWGLERW